MFGDFVHTIHNHIMKIVWWVVESGNDFQLIDIHLIRFAATSKEEASQQEGCTSPISCEKSWAEKDCQSIVRKTPEELRHW